eukprot:10070008-Heterocapsa_arctica.AAC.2
MEKTVLAGRDVSRQVAVAIIINHEQGVLSLTLGRTTISVLISKVLREAETSDHGLGWPHLIQE